MDIGSHLLKDRNIGFGESSNLLTTGKQQFYIYKNAIRKTGLWTAKSPEKLGVFREDIFFVLFFCHCTMKEMHLGFDSMVLNHHDPKMQRLSSEQPVDEVLGFDAVVGSIKTLLKGQHDFFVVIADALKRCKLPLAHVLAHHGLRWDITMA